MTVVKIVVVPSIVVTQLLPLSVGNGGVVSDVVPVVKEPVVGLDDHEENGAVPMGAVPPLDGGREPERDPLGALNGTELLDAGKVCEDGAVPDGALTGKEEVPPLTSNADEEERLPERDPMELVNGGAGTDSDPKGKVSV